jgi:predicted DNA-binding protein
MRLPRKPNPDATKPTSIALPPSMKTRLDEAAKRNGRKPGAEMRARLEATLVLEDRFFLDDPDQYMNRLIANSIVSAAEMISASDGHWSQSNHAREILSAALKVIVEEGASLSDQEDSRHFASDTMTPADQGSLIGKVLAPRLLKKLTPFKFMGISREENQDSN